MDDAAEFLSQFTVPTTCGAAQALAALDDRVTALIDRLAPQPEDMRRRGAIIEYLEGFVERCFPGTRLLPYGSYITRIFLPDGDIDLICLCPRKDRDAVFQALSLALREILGVSSPGIPALTNLVEVRADVPVLKLMLDGIFVDISFASPAGLVTSLFLQLMDEAIGRAHLFKRSLLLVQAWCTYEAHVLGSHAQMLNSYCLRAMVCFILVHSPECVHPMQVLLKFLGFFSCFDYGSATLTAFGVIDNSHLVDVGSRALYEYHLRNPVAAQYIDQDTYAYLMMCRLLFRPELQGVLFEDSERSPEHPIAHALKEAMNTSVPTDTGKPRGGHGRTIRTTRPSTQSTVPTSERLRVLLQNPSRLAQAVPLERGSPFASRILNVVDPVYPENNLGRALGGASLARMRLTFQAGYAQVAALMSLVADRTAPLTAIMAEFDLLFANTFAHYSIEGLMPSEDISHRLSVSTGALYRRVVKVLAEYLEHP
ncbi:Topoisomerase I-related protein [Giardia muris]|uniref:Topoisomerase I-related protein n=1 Tax=Giardia muris TaxID=5742 RepID=A0A4Z1T5R5_GIAMU|nr:Topoisomerase I-related protein [Giardia muris]|eukprot:TNJ27811.1 Topoisomerase I-related protein [Giardia muris]